MLDLSNPGREPGTGIRIPNPDFRLRDETSGFLRDEPDSLSKYTDEVDRDELRRLAGEVLDGRRP